MQRSLTIGDEAKIAPAQGMMRWLRGLIGFLAVLLFIPALNPLRTSALIAGNSSLFTIASSYGGLREGFGRALNNGWIDAATLHILYVSAVIILVGTATAVVAACLSLGEHRLRRLGTQVAVLGGLLSLIGLALVPIVYQRFVASPQVRRLDPELPAAWFILLGLQLILILSALIALRRVGKPAPDARYEMHAKYRLFLMFLPFLVLVLVFAYLPLWGWRYAFFDYKPGAGLSWDNFVGFKWFSFLFLNDATRADMRRVLTNTLVMSGLGIGTSWLPMLFAILLVEIRASRLRKAVQTLTTIPNFISWVLVYSFAFALFSTEGFVNQLLIDLRLAESGSNFLMSGDYIWLKMWAWGTWKGLGWSAIIYVAAISGIDQQLYEAATVDGAGRLRRMLHVTLPGLIPTFTVLLLLSIANVLSNGMEQYFVFKNSANKDTIEVLDLFVYTLGLGGRGGTGNIPLATVVGMFKTVISVTLLFVANRVSKIVRGDAIV